MDTLEATPHDLVGQGDDRKDSRTYRRRRQENLLLPLVDSYIEETHKSATSHQSSE